MTYFSDSSSCFEIEKILPFIELAGESSIQFGPLLFSSAASSFLEKKEDQDAFYSYLQTIGLVKPLSERAHKDRGATFLAPSQITCLFIHSSFSSLSEKMRKSLIMDALHLLYFASYFRNLYEGQAAPSFNPFRKMVPASLEFIRDKKNWEHLSIQAIDQEETVQLHFPDFGICQGLGRLLEGIYRMPSLDPLPHIQMYKRFVRAIRYLVDRLFHRFVNLFDRESRFSSEEFEAEEIIFLALSFEALFNISDRQPSADFKHKLRPLLHLKYGSPMEMFWKWVDDFYAVKQAVMRGEILCDPIFHMNPNFEISHLLLGTKLFIYSVYYTLFQYQLIAAAPSDPYISPNFKWIQLEEVLLFFWTEENLLRKLNLFIRQQRLASRDELYADIHLLTHLYVFLYQRYDFGERKIPGVCFIPSSADHLKREGQAILEQLEQENIENPEGKLKQVIDPYFLEALEKRLRSFHPP